MHTRVMVTVILTIFCVTSNSMSQMHGGSKGINWPSYRGENASGIADDYSTPINWAVDGSMNIQWKMAGGGDIPVPTPVVAHNLIFINSSHGRMSPIYAIKMDSQGNISLGDKETSNDYIVWSVSRGGAYMQTPLVYGDFLYNLRGNGSLSCYRAKTGELIYREKVGQLRSFSASGVAADGKLYFPGERGNIYVVKAGPDFELLSTNPMNDICMATPAISEGILFFRTHHYLVAVSGR